MLNITNVAAVPMNGIVTNVGKNVPMIEPIVLKASILPTTFPLVSRFLVANLIIFGVTIPSIISGKTNTTKQLISEAHIK